MAYLINLSDGRAVTINDSTVDTEQFSIPLVGRNTTGYGEHVMKAMLQLLENSASGSEPLNPTEGQTWWDIAESEFKLRKGSDWISFPFKEGQNYIFDGNILPSQNCSGGEHNIGSSTLEFCTVYAQEFSGTAARARYADIAEKYHADKVYEPGTIVMLGGEKEITEFGQSSDVPFGVVSTAPAFLMNATEETGADEWLPVALAGRVPVRVVGEVLVGDYLVASRKYPGCAEVGHRSSPEVIGRALGRSSDQDEKLVEAVTRFVL